MPPISSSRSPAVSSSGSSSRRYIGTLRRWRMGGSVRDARLGRPRGPLLVNYAKYGENCARRGREGGARHGRWRRHGCGDGQEAANERGGAFPLHDAWRASRRGCAPPPVSPNGKRTRNPDAHNIWHIKRGGRSPFPDVRNLADATAGCQPARARHAQQCRKSRHARDLPQMGSLQSGHGSACGGRAMRYTNSLAPNPMMAPRSPSCSNSAMPPETRVRPFPPASIHIDEISSRS